MSAELIDHSSPEKYHENADPERDSAKRLADSLKPWRFSVPRGPLLEVGAGTGIFTPHLKTLLPKRDIVVSDASQQMLKYSMSVLRDESNDQFSFSKLNAETDDIEEETYALICGNHVAHQFRHPAITLEKLALGLRIDGIMLMSFPGEDSFREWRSTCLDLGIPFTGRSMPGTEPLVIHLSSGPVQVDFYEDQSAWYFDNFESFRSHMMAGGLEIEEGERRLNDKEKALLNENWSNTKDGKLGFTYHNVFLAVKRIG
jgi:malonyl-CoA O-methyltransferase